MVTDNPMMNCPAPPCVGAASGGRRPDAANHYFLKANYYHLVDEDDVRCWLTAIWHNEETTRNFELGTNELHIDVILDGQHINHWTRVNIPYTEVWDILHQHKKGSPSANGWKTTLYYNHATMQMPPTG
jgi:hypothetical protein